MLSLLTRPRILVRLAAVEEALIQCRAQLGELRKIK